MNYSVTKNGVPLDKSLYNWDENTKTFSSNEDNLVLDFSSIIGAVIKTGNCCTIDTGSRCTIDTGRECVLVRRDVYEVIELKEGQKIKLNDFEVRGFTVIEEEKKKVTLELTDKQLEEIKKIIK